MDMGACKHPWATHPAPGQELSINMWMEFNFWLGPNLRFLHLCFAPILVLCLGQRGQPGRILWNWGTPQMGSKQWYRKCPISIWKMMRKDMQPSNSGVYAPFSDPNSSVSDRQYEHHFCLSTFRACEIGNQGKVRWESKGLKMSACGMHIWYCTQADCLLHSQECGLDMHGLIFPVQYLMIFPSYDGDGFVQLGQAFQRENKTFSWHF